MPPPPPDPSAAPPSVADRARRRFARDVGALTLAQAVQYAVPLVALPYLGRVLGPGAWGEAAAAVALGNLAAALPEYGFGFSAVRALAQRPAERASMVGGVLGARALLTLAALAVVAVCVALPGVPPHADALGLGVLAYVAAHGLAFGWYFEGTGRFGRAAVLYALARLPVPVLLVAFVHGPADAPRVPLAYAAAALASLALALVWLRRDGVLARPRWPDVHAALREGRTLFVSRLGLLAYLGGNAYWLRLFAPAATVGLFVPGEQAARAACGAFGPLSRSLLPRLSAADPAARRRLLGRAFVGAVVLGGALSTGLFVAAPLLPRVFGADFAGSVGVLRVLAPLPLLVAVSQVAGVQGLMAAGRDRAVALAFGLGAVVNLGGAALLAPRFGATGMAAAAVAAEAAVTLAAVLLLGRSFRRAGVPGA